MPAAERREGAGLIVVGGERRRHDRRDHGGRPRLPGRPVERSKELGGFRRAPVEASPPPGPDSSASPGSTMPPERLAATSWHAGVGPSTGSWSARSRSRARRWSSGSPTAAARACACSTTGGRRPAPARLHAVGEQGGAALVAALTRVAARTTIQVRVGTEATGLVPDDGGVAGVAFRPDRRGSRRSPAGRARVRRLRRDDELIAEHCPAVKDLPFGGAPPRRATASASPRRRRPHGGPRTAARCTALFALPAQLEVPDACCSTPAASW